MSNDLSVFFTVLLAICGGITIIYGGVSTVVKLFSPYQEIKDRIKKHDVILDKDNKRLNEIEETNKIELKCMLALLDHQITGNGIERMREIRNDLQNYLTDK